LAGDEAAAWDTIDLLLRLDPAHAEARALVGALWQPATPFARSLALHLVSVTYDRTAAPVQASVVIEVSHLAPPDTAVADSRRP